ncbi:hypothetical protein LJE82_06535 [bacterium BMS3Abin03]|jgi:hypothetical protein|nr:hypothetical protein [bacterium BMS3Abin03]
MRKPRIIWFIPNPRWLFFHRITGKTAWHPDISLPSIWIRSYQIAPYLQKAGYSTNYNTVDPLPDVAIFLRRYKKEDVELAQYLKSKGTRIILDVVANYFEERIPDKYGNGQSSNEQVKNFFEFLEIADQVWTVSPYLKTIAEDYHSNVHFVSDSIDTNHFQIDNENNAKQEPPFLLGWSGSPSKAQELNLLTPLLDYFIRSELINVIVISNKSPDLKFKYRFRRWKYSTFPKFISLCDLCIAPRMVRNDYDRGHSLFKIGVFMTMGVPVFAGPVPSYYLLLDDGKAGKICNSIDDWKFELEEFIYVKEVRQDLRAETQKKIQPYQTKYISEKIDMLLRNLI